MFRQSYTGWETGRGQTTAQTWYRPASRRLTPSLTLVCHQRSGHQHECGEEQRPVEVRRQDVGHSIVQARQLPQRISHEDVQRERDARRAQGPDVSRGPLTVRDSAAMVPQTIIKTAIETGASTGPHHGSGSRNRTSQSNSDRGQPHMTRRKT